MQKITDNIFVLVLLGISGIVVLVTGFIIVQVKNQHRILLQKKKLQHAAIQHQQDLLRTAITSQEEERRRIGMDLHDQVGSLLSAFKYSIDHFVSIMPVTDLTEPFTVQSKSFINQAINNVRTISHNLSPFIKGAYGLYDAILDLRDTINKQGNILFITDMDEANLPGDINTDVMLALYRVIIELTTNTIKHSGGRHIYLSLRKKQDRLHVIYRDDGTGMTQKINRNGNGIGMKNIESRLSAIGAFYTMQTNEPGGFFIRITLPLTDKTVCI